MVGDLEKVLNENIHFAKCRIKLIWSHNNLMGLAANTLDSLPVNKLGCHCMKGKCRVVKYLPAIPLDRIWSKQLCYNCRQNITDSQLHAQGHTSPKDLEFDF